MPPTSQVAAGTETVASLDAALLAKLERLRDAIRARRGALVAYSGGVDSSLIAAVALSVAGPYDPARADGRGVLAVLADSHTLARRELTEARLSADRMGIPLEEIGYSELANAAWVQNDAMRCYHCKKDLASELLAVAPKLGYVPEQIAYGITTTDLSDHRPGIQATRDAGAWHPLVDAGLSKAEVRALARHLDVPVWDKPATPCLASRVQYGESIEAETLARIEAAEDALHGLGFPVCRVRHHDKLARVEVPRARLPDAFAVRAQIHGALRDAGYTYVTLDLMGFRSGAMNEVLPETSTTAGPAATDH